MALPNIFSEEVYNEILTRINKLTVDSQPLWGKMSVGQMLSHCCVTYELIYEKKHPEPGAFARLMLRLFVKGPVTGEKPYGRHSRTAPAFIQTEPKVFEAEKARLISYLKKTHDLGPSWFDGRLYHSFGKMTRKEWNNMFYKHLDHHLRQFGV